MKGQTGTYAYSPFLSPQSAHFGQHYLVTCRHIAAFVFVALQVRLSAVNALRQTVIARRQKGGWEHIWSWGFTWTRSMKKLCFLNFWIYLASSTLQESHFIPSNLYAGMRSLLDLKLRICNFLCRCLLPETFGWWAVCCLSVYHADV